MKDSIIFHFENLEDLEDLSAEQVGQIFLAMIEFTKTGEEPVFDDPFMRKSWKPIRRRLMFDIEYYEKKSRAGSKGGAPIGNKNASKKQAETSTEQAETSKNKLYTTTYTTTNTTDRYIAKKNNSKQKKWLFTEKMSHDYDMNELSRRAKA